MKREIEKIREFLIDYAKKSGTDGYVLGISGGVDSSVLYKIIEPVKELKFLSVMLPIHSLETDEDHARILTRGNEANVLKVDLSDVYDDLVRVLPKTDHKLAYANIKPRLRMTALYNIAQANNLLVAGASNKTEYMIGYFTKHGDSGVDILPLADFTKHEIYEMARELGVPDEIILKPPSAGLYTGQSDEEEIGLSYDDLDAGVEGRLEDEEKNKKIQRMIKISDHKRAGIPIYRKGRD